ncbi:MAG TPA: phosphoglucosamine mutase [Bacteroidales bacterium]|nr:phosphoglucosamine mutase [Bacteroidales bacterium]
MALIKSISGIRGTIGGKPGENLTPPDIVKFTSAYGTWIRRRCGKPNPEVVVGRDGRKSGSMVQAIIVNTLRSTGINVTELGMATTPTVEMAVTGTKADGGIIITASHNPAEWNALKLLTEAGEFLNAAEGNEVLELGDRDDFEFCQVDELGKVQNDDSWGKKHIESILALKLVDREAIRQAGFTVAVDCINSVGGIIVPQLLKELGVKNVVELNTNPDGNFAHNPEPLPQNLHDISELVLKEKADLGFVVDPDVDRLAIICEDGSMFGEEYTLVAVSDYVLSNVKGSTVSNLSSSRALRDVSEQHDCSYFSAAVGEVNVVEEMKKNNSVIGGEGNGGIIYPELHYGRDALVGIALFLTHLAKSRLSCLQLRKKYPEYVMAKKKQVLSPSADFSSILKKIKEEFKGLRTDERDGLWIGTDTGWVQVRKSNTEPVMRIYSEGRTISEAEGLADKVIEIVKKA